MSEVAVETQVVEPRSSRKAHIKVWLATVAALGVFGAGVVFGPGYLAPSAKATAPGAPIVTVSVPAERNLEKRLQFLGQFSAVQQVELRPRRHVD